MKAVMLSIQPKWCELIASGKKTIEVRKTRPKLQTPFKCYIYCTKRNSERLLFILKDGDENYGEVYHGKPIFVKGETGSVCDMFYQREKVIGEFVCDKIDSLYIPISTSATPPDKEDVEKATCLSLDELKKYANGKMFLYGWHISDFKIYDKPKELGEFFTACHKLDGDQCDDCPHLRVELCHYHYGDDIDVWCGVDNKKPITRPPQSWCYVEELSE